MNCTWFEDFRVAPTQAFMGYRALKDNDVEVKFVAFAGRAYTSSETVNARERTRLSVEWVRTHVGGGPIQP